MYFKPFDKTQQNNLREEAKNRWGKTAAWSEFEQKSGNADIDGLMKIFAEFGKIKHLSPSGEEACSLIKKLQNFITENFYTCIDEILSGLGKMYIADERFRQNIDAVGGDGTAKFAAKAIELHTLGR